MSETNPPALWYKIYIMLPQHLQLGDNPYLIDQLHFMQDQEETHYQITDDYLRPNRPCSSKVTPTDRETMARWSYDIVDSCSIDREVACIAMNYFDRFMCTPSPRANKALISRREFQLAFITCLIIALKGRAGMQVDSDFVSDTICQRMYQSHEILKMEVEILRALEWRLSGPSPHEFIAGMVELMPSYIRSNDVKVVHRLELMAKMQAEAAMVDYSMALQRPSTIAYAALVTAMQAIDVDAFHPLDRLAWKQNIALVTGIKANDTLSSDGRCFAPVEAASSPASSGPSTPTSIKNDNHHRELMCTPEPYLTNMASIEGYAYCSPVSGSSTPPYGHSYPNPNSSNDFDDRNRASWTSVSGEYYHLNCLQSYDRSYNEHLYLDTLSMTSSSDDGSSPTSAMF